MATQHLDFESQEQVARLKHYWDRYGNLLLGILIAALLVFLGWRYYQQHLHKQALQAASLYTEMQKAAENKDLPKVERIYADIKQRYGSSAYAEQAALLAASALEESKPDAAKQALAWLSQEGKQTGYVALARLRASALAYQAKSYDEALKYLASGIPDEFAALANDRRGDIYLAQNKAAEAISAYQKAYASMADDLDYRRMIEVKLNALGVDPKASTPAAAVAASVAAK